MFGGQGHGVFSVSSQQSPKFAQIFCDGFWGDTALSYFGKDKQSTFQCHFDIVDMALMVGRVIDKLGPVLRVSTLEVGYWKHTLWPCLFFLSSHVLLQPN